MHIVIPDELVPLLRRELFNDLHGQLEEAGVLVVSRGQADIRVAADGDSGRADGTRALLDAVGWIEPVDPPAIVEIDVRKHRTTLLRTLLTRIESEHSIEEDPEANEEDRATAKARIGELADLIAQAEGAGDA
jgi:hypothetical protein